MYCFILLGYFKMLTNEQEIAFLLIFGLEWMRDNGANPIVKDFTKAVDDANLFVSRERQELASRTINTNVLIAHAQTRTKIDVTRLGVTDAKSAVSKTKQANLTNMNSTKPAVIEKKKDCASNQPSSSVSYTNNESEDDEPTVAITNKKVKNMRHTPVHQRLRQRKPVAATTSATMKVQQRATSLTRAKKAGGIKRKNDDLEDSDSNDRLVTLFFNDP
jgi:hypothetical protein